MLCVSEFKSLEGNLLCWNQSRAVNALVSRAVLSLWEMKLFSIAASEIPVFLGLCRGIKWAPTFLLGILVQPCDKTLSLLIVL